MAVNYTYTPHRVINITANRTATLDCREAFSKQTTELGTVSHRRAVQGTDDGSGAARLSVFKKPFPMLSVI